jgi:RNA polymerase sigma-70 factor (ECF subfamily)
LKPNLLMDLVEEHSPWLNAMAWQLVPGAGLESQDLVQETLLALARMPNPPAHPRTWLWRTLRNLAVSARRTQARRTRRELEVSGREVLDFDPLATLVRKEQVSTLRELIASLPAEDRELLVALHWGGHTFAEAADVLNKPASSLHRRHQEILARLKEKIAPVKEDTHVDSR